MDKTSIKIFEQNFDDRIFAEFCVNGEMFERMAFKGNDLSLTNIKKNALKQFGKRMRQYGWDGDPKHVKYEVDIWNEIKL